MCYVLCHFSIRISAETVLSRITLAPAHFKHTCSGMNREYALRDPPPNDLDGFQAARAYLDFPQENGISLRDNLVQILGAIVEQLKRGRSAMRLMGSMDEPKLRSSAKLFECVSRASAGRGNADVEINTVCRTLLSLLHEQPLPPLPIDHPIYQRMPAEVTETGAPGSQLVAHDLTSASCLSKGACGCVTSWCVVCGYGGVGYVGCIRDLGDRRERSRRPRAGARDTTPPSPR